MLKTILAAALLGLILSAHSHAAERPNILFILADDLGYGDVSCYNDRAKVPTPNLDRLAREGMRSTDAHSPATVCTPSRYSLMTGQMAFRVPNGGTVFEGVGGPSLIAAGRLTLPAMLRAKSYATACVGKWHVGLTFFDKDGQPIRTNGVEAVRRVDFSRRIEGGPLDHGFDRFFGTACCPATDFLYAFIDGDRIPVPPTRMLDKSKLPKHPYAFDNRAGLIATDYDLEELDMVFLKKSREFLEQHTKSHPEKPFFLLHSMNAVHLPSFASKQFQGSTKAGPHGDFIHELDHIVGELMNTLERLGLANKTVVMFSSDNGPETTSIVHMRADYDHDGARPWRGMKRDQWEGGHRVPFLVRWPGQVKPGTTSAQLTSLTDVMVAVGPNMFYTVTLPCTLWFLDKGKAASPCKTPSPQPSPTGRGSAAAELLSPTGRRAGDEGSPPTYRDVPGLCKAAKIEEIAANGWSLNPGRYVGVAAGEAVSDEDFKEQLETLNEELETLNAAARELETTIANNVTEILEA